MAMRVLLFVALILVSHLATGAQAQTPSPATGATTASPSKQQIKAAKKAERIAIRKKRAECYDQAKKEKVADKDLTRFLADCRKK